MPQLIYHASLLLWPEAEDRALRGRNLSAVFRTLDRQVGKQHFPSCAQTWRVENQCDKSMHRSSRNTTTETNASKDPFSTSIKLKSKLSKSLSIFSGQAHVVAAPGPDECVRQGLLENAAVAVTRRK